MLGGDSGVEYDAEGEASFKESESLEFSEPEDAGGERNKKDGFGELVAFFRILWPSTVTKSF